MKANWSFDIFNLIFTPQKQNSDLIDLQDYAQSIFKDCQSYSNPLQIVMKPKKESILSRAKSKLSTSKASMTTFVESFEIYVAIENNKQ